MIDLSSNNLKHFIEKSFTATAMFDTEMKYIAVSDKFIEEYQLPNKNIIGHSHYEVFPEISDHWKEIHKRCL